MQKTKHGSLVAWDHSVGSYVPLTSVIVVAFQKVQSLEFWDASFIIIIFPRLVCIGYGQKQTILKLSDSRSHPFTISHEFVGWLGGPTGLEKVGVVSDVFTCITVSWLEKWNDSTFLKSPHPPAGQLVHLFSWRWQRSKERKKNVPLLVSSLLLSQWPKQITRPTLESAQEGALKGHGHRKASNIGTRNAIHLLHWHGLKL